MGAKFSIIVPAYNAKEHLSECLNSVTKQDYTDYELVLIDDGSIDGTAEILDTYASTHDNCMVLHGPNEGLLLARRKGLKYTKGDYIVFLDADDALRQDALNVLANVIDKTQADIIAYQYSNETDFKRPCASLKTLEPGYYIDEGFDQVRSYVCTGNFNYLWQKAIRRSCIDIDADYSSFAGVMHGEDLIQLLPIIDESKSLVMLEDILYFYRISPDGSTLSFRSSQLADLAKVNKRLLEYAKKWGNSCYENALRGELAFYITRLKRSEISNIPITEKKNNFETIREAMIEQDVFSRALLVTHRSDRRLICHFLKSGNRTMAGLLIRLIETLKHFR